MVLTSVSCTGTRLHLSSISRAARDISVGKGYEGGHFRKSALDGEALGRQIAGYVFTHAFREEE